MNVEPLNRKQGRAVVLTAIMVLSVVAMSAAFAGTTAGQQPSEIDEIFFDEGELYEDPAIWHGQVIGVSGFDGEEDYALRNADGVENVYTANAGGAIFVDTTEYEPGIFYFDGPGSVGDIEDNNFEIVEQTLSASFEEPVELDGTTELELDSNRPTYEVTVEADNLTDSEVENVLGSTTLTDADGTHDADFDGIEAGTYEFTFNVTDTTAETTTAVEVDPEPVVERSFTQDVFEAEQGGIANISFAVQNTSTAAIQIGTFDPDEEQYHEVGYELRDIEENTTNHLFWNLYMAGGGALPNDLLQRELVENSETGWTEGYAINYEWNVSAEALGEWEQEYSTSLEDDEAYFQIGSEPLVQSEYYQEYQDGDRELIGHYPNQTYLDDDGGFLPADRYRVTIGDEFEDPIQTEFDEEHDIPVVDAQMNTIDDSATVNVSPLEPPEEATLSVVPNSADPVEDYDDLNLSTLGDGVSNIDAGESVAVQVEEGQIVDGDHLLVSIEDAGLEGSLAALGLAKGGADAEFSGKWDELLPVTIDEVLHFSQSGIQLDMVQENPMLFRDDVKVSTNMTQYGLSPQPGPLGTVEPMVPDDADEWSQLVLDYPVLKQRVFDTANPFHPAYPMGAVEHYDGHQTFQLDYQALENADDITTDNPAEITVDVTGVAELTGLPEGFSVELDSEVVFEEAFIEFPDVSTLPDTETASITVDTNLAAGHELEAVAESRGWIQPATAEVDQNRQATFEFDLSVAEPGDTFDINATGPLEASGDLENLTIGEPDEPEPASFDVDASAPSTVAPGDDASLDVTVTNGGDEDGASNYTVTVDGETVADEMVSLNASDSTSSSYTIDTAETGDVSWSVETDDDSASGTVTIEEEDDETDDGADDEEEEDDGDGVPGFGVAVALVALLAAAMLALRRQD